MIYEFDRYIGACQMAQGARIEAASEAEAIEKARAIFAVEARPGEMERTRFVRRAYQQGVRSDG